jgi:uncharacterized protein
MDPARGADHHRSVGADRLGRLDWPGLEAQLEAQGYAQTPPMLTGPECAGLARLYDDETRFRSRVVMERHRFGVGEYKYFARPLPLLVESLRSRLYPPLAAIANRWMETLADSRRFPPTLEAFLAVCAKAGQKQPTPLLLRYEAGGYNCLHQDLYGEVAFPLQVAVMLTRPGRDYTGGEFLLVEQRPRSQSAGEAITAGRGEMVIFTNRLRPVRGSRGFYRVNVRHGVSRVRSGHRLTLGIIFHDAK